MLIRSQGNPVDFLNSGPDFQRAWRVLAGVEIPPSVEVFEHGYEAADDETPTTPTRYALTLVAGYKRAARPLKTFGCAHQARVERNRATVCPICDALQWMPLAD